MTNQQLSVLPLIVTTHFITYSDPAVNVLTAGVVTISPVTEADPLKLVEVTFVVPCHSVHAGLDGVPQSAKSIA